MIKRTFFTTILLLIAYASIIRLKPKVLITQHQWQDNIIKAQSFIYNEYDTNRNVIVGSSLSSRLVMDSLSGFENLSFAGQGIFDGLNIIGHKEKVPKKIFIETNVVLRNMDENFNESLFNPLLFNLRKFVPSLRDGKQPIAILGFYSGTIIYKIINKIKATKITDVQVNVIRNDEGDIFNKLLNDQISYYSKVPNSFTLKKTLENLKEQVAVLEKKGAEIIFFEMPINKNLCKQPLANIIRQNFHSYFPLEKYKYINQPDCGLYKTTDGIHLDTQEALIYTSYFKDNLKKLYLLP